MRTRALSSPRPSANLVGRPGQGTPALLERAPPSAHSGEEPSSVSRRTSFMSTPEGGTSSSGNWSRRLQRAAPVIIVSSVTFSFISYWKTAAVVLCDLASTAYYIGGIVEQSIGAAAPWFILAVMCFSYAVRWVYIESCTLFVRGGVYRVVREALGSWMAKIAVSALMFDYILTGPISSVTAGQYVIGFVLDLLSDYGGVIIVPEAKTLWKNWGAVVLSCSVTVYFFYQNLRGI